LNNQCVVVGDEDDANDDSDASLLQSSCWLPFVQRITVFRDSTEEA
jgi:hypothetical protein